MSKVEFIILILLTIVLAWLSWHQLISWGLLGGSLLVAAFGFYLFYHHGKPADGMEETTALITSGLYRYIRHPLYLSLIIGGFGVMMKDLKLPSIVLALVNLMALYVTARVEEKEMFKRFGTDYEKYMTRTKMFIPFIF